MTHVIEMQGQEWLDRWRAKVGDDEADRISNYTANEGTLIHRATELYDKKRLAELDTLLRKNLWLVPYAFAWSDWVRRCVQEWIWIEQVVWKDG